MAAFQHGARARRNHISSTLSPSPYHYRRVRRARGRTMRHRRRCGHPRSAQHAFVRTGRRSNRINLSRLFHGRPAVLVRRPSSLPSRSRPFRSRPFHRTTRIRFADTTQQPKRQWGSSNNSGGGGSSSSSDADAWHPVRILNVS